MGFQAFSALPFTRGVPMSLKAEDTFSRLQSVWATALGRPVFEQISLDNVSEYFLTFALEPAAAFKSMNTPRFWMSDARDLQCGNSPLKKILEQTLVLTVYGADPVPRLNTEICGMILPPVRLGVFYSSPDPAVMCRKYNVDIDT